MIVRTSGTRAAQLVSPADSVRTNRYMICDAQSSWSPSAVTCTEFAIST